MDHAGLGAEAAVEVRDTAPQEDGRTRVQRRSAISPSILPMLKATGDNDGMIVAAVRVLSE